MVKTIYFDCIAGASGDMILGALVDAGLPLETLRERLAALHLDDFELQSHRVAKNAFAATKVDVIVKDRVPERHVSDLVHIVEVSDLAPAIKERAVAIFNKMGEAEARIHDAPLDHVHLHELGGVDTIVDVVGALAGLDALGVEWVVVSPVPLGRGFIRGAHGQIPLPAPATVSLLKGVPVVGSPLEMETVTPTGAVLLATLADDFGPIPAMTLTAVGYGAGSLDLPIPNVLRVLLGDSAAGSKPHLPEQAHGHDHPHHHDHDHPHGHDHSHNRDHDHAHTSTPAHAAVAVPDAAELAVLETNIDDLNPEIYEYVMGRLFAAGALDVFFAPIQMKKNRPATLLRALCRPEDVPALAAILFAETTTLGVREHRVRRHTLPRESCTVETPYGPVRVKIARLGDGQVKSAPEYEDCRRLAGQHGVPLREVYHAAMVAIHE
ncbi:MAG: nickel pincer cofactor biosynthesis protein LarC [Anaerolineae bacterium]|nr:nickel pincer cofactor biosynthesis protein LarC [Anaerolineae bacterium]